MGAELTLVARASLTSRALASHLGPPLLWPQDLQSSRSRAEPTGLPLTDLSPANFTEHLLPTRLSWAVRGIPRGPRQSQALSWQDTGLRAGQDSRI